MRCLEFDTDHKNFDNVQKSYTIRDEWYKEWRKNFFLESAPIDECKIYDFGGKGYNL